MTPDQNPPQRTMSLDIIGTTLRSDAPTQYMRLAAMEALTALRDELERVKLAAYAGRCGLDLSEKVIASKDSEIADLRTGLSVKDEMLKEHVQQLADQSAKMASLEAQAGAMREALLILYWRNGMLDVHPTQQHVKEVLSSQAGADLLQREQALRDALGWLLSFVGQAPQKDYAAFLSKHVPVGSFTSMDELEGKLNECIGKGWSAIASKDAALSQEQAMTRTG